MTQFSKHSWTFETVYSISTLYKLSPSQMEKFSQISDFSGFSDLFDKVAQQTSHMNTFLNLNISDTPLAIIKSGMAQGGAAGYLLVFSAAMVPILAWLTQWMNYKLRWYRPVRSLPEIYHLLP